MKSFCWVAIIAASLLSQGCAGPKGHSVSDKRQYVQDMKQRTLDELHARNPETQGKIADAAGYAVFSNIGFTALYLGAGNGYGVVVANQSGQETYMRMFRGTAGLGLGLKDFRAVFVFHDQSSLDRFVRQGWEFSAEGEASAKSGDKGDATGVAGHLSGIDVYELTESGVSASATLTGTKFWWDAELNE